jgi:indolepyruvate ferredoxin oxidoreductase
LTVFVDDQVTAPQTFHENGNIDLEAERLVRCLLSTIGSIEPHG